MKGDIDRNINNCSRASRLKSFENDLKELSGLTTVFSFDAFMQAKKVATAKKVSPDLLISEQLVPCGHNTTSSIEEKKLDL